jgi:hypothetical protein
MPSYIIWRVQDFHDLDKRDIIYRKINTTLSSHFKGDEHVSYKEAKKEADKYIDYIYSVNGTFTTIAPYLDKLYIIKNSDNIEKYDGDEYYNMKYLLSNYNNKIKRYNKNKYTYKLCSILLLFFIRMFIGAIYNTNTIMDIWSITKWKNK